MSDVVFRLKLRSCLGKKYDETNIVDIINTLQQLRKMTDGKRLEEFSDYIFVLENGMQIPFDSHTNLAGQLVHTHPIDGGELCFNSSKDYSKTLMENKHKSVWILKRGDEMCCVPSSKNEALVKIKMRVVRREEEDAHKRMCNRCELRNVDPHDVISAQNDNNVTERIWESLTSRASQLPSFQPWMVGYYTRSDFMGDRRLTEVIPSWFVFAPYVSLLRFGHYIDFLKSRHSEYDWERIMKAIVPDAVFDDTNDARIHYQNLPGHLFLKMRLLSCIERYNSDSLKDALKESGLCKYFVAAFEPL